MISIEVSRSQTEVMLKRIGSRVKNLEPPLTGFCNYFLVETEKQFEQERDPDGVPWARLAPSTLAQKRRLGYPNKILTRTGKMRKSVVAIADAKSILIGVDTEYAIYHQEGTSKMPQRRILGLNDKRKEKLVKLIRVYIGLKR